MMLESAARVAGRRFCCLGENRGRGPWIVVHAAEERMGVRRRAWEIVEAARPGDPVSQRFDISSSR